MKIYSVNHDINNLLLVDGLLVINGNYYLTAVAGSTALSFQNKWNAYYLGVAGLLYSTDTDAYSGIIDRFRRAYLGQPVPADPGISEGNIINFPALQKTWTPPYAEVPTAVTRTVLTVAGNPSVITYYDSLGAVVATQTFTWDNGNMTSETWS